jgi:DtxR family Mn-dependent transcriptional regulator
MIKQLAENNLVDHAPYRGVRLTADGRRIALEVIRHHRLLELYLHRALGYGWDEVDAEAEKLEHFISEDFEDRIDKLLGFPLTDPHGDPIPTRDGAVSVRPSKSLAEMEPGDQLVVMRVRDSNAEVLRYLERIGLKLEAVFRLTEKQPFNGPLTVAVGDAIHTIGRELAGHVFVDEFVEDFAAKETIQ